MYTAPRTAATKENEMPAGNRQSRDPTLPRRRRRQSRAQQRREYKKPARFLVVHVRTAAATNGSASM